MSILLFFALALVTVAISQSTNRYYYIPDALAKSQCYGKNVETIEFIINGTLLPSAVATSFFLSNEAKSWTELENLRTAGAPHYLVFDHNLGTVSYGDAKPKTAGTANRWNTAVSYSNALVRGQAFSLHVVYNYRTWEMRAYDIRGASPMMLSTVTVPRPVSQVPVYYFGFEGMYTDLKRIIRFTCWVTTTV